jgi:hypothetical protein
MELPMLRRKETASLGERVMEQLHQARQRLKNMPPGPERTEALKKEEKLRHAADSYHYLFSSELKPPE